MRTHFKILFYAKKREPLRNGCWPIMCRITINKSSCCFSTHLSVKQGGWNNAQKRAAGRSKEACRINKLLDEIHYMLYDAYMVALRMNSAPTPEKVRNLYRNDYANSLGIVAYFEKHNEGFEKMVGVSRSKNTLYKYRYVCQHLKNFIYKRYLKYDMPINDITKDFVCDFHGWLIEDRKCCVNSAWLYMIALKHIFACAVNDGLILLSPFSGYKLHQQNVRKNCLDKNDLRNMIAFKPTSIAHRQIIDAFVFCCFTGLSYADVKRLRMCDINFIGGKRWLTVFRMKTGTAVNVPLLQIPYYLIKRHYRDDDSPIFNLPSNCWCNQILRRIAFSIGIKQNISFHTARHTFATTVTLNNGVPVEVVSYMLGHTDIKTTQIYARVKDSSVVSQMQRVSKELEPYFESQLSNFSISQSICVSA